MDGSPAIKMSQKHIEHSSVPMDEKSENPLTENEMSDSTKEMSSSSGEHLSFSEIPKYTPFFVNLEDHFHSQDRLSQHNDKPLPSPVLVMEAVSSTPSTADCITSNILTVSSSSSSSLSSIAVVSRMDLCTGNRSLEDTKDAEADSLPLLNTNYNDQSQNASITLPLSDKSSANILKPSPVHKCRIARSLRAVRLYRRQKRWKRHKKYLVSSTILKMSLETPHSLDYGGKGSKKIPSEKSSNKEDENRPDTSVSDGTCSENDFPASVSTSLLFLFLCPCCLIFLAIFLSLYRVSSNLLRLILLSLFRVVCFPFKTMHSIVTYIRSLFSPRNEQGSSTSKPNTPKQDELVCQAKADLGGLGGIKGIKD